MLNGLGWNIEEKMGRRSGGRARLLHLLQAKGSADMAQNSPSNRKNWQKATSVSRRDGNGMHHPLFVLLQGRCSICPCGPGHKERPVFVCGEDWSPACDSRSCPLHMSPG